MKKSIIGMIFIASLYIVIFNVSFGVSNVNLVVDGKDIIAMSNPVIENDRTLIPVRFVSEELGADVVWNDTDKTVLIKKGDKSLFLKIDSRIVSYNNDEFYQLSDVAPKIINERTYVPVRLVSNALGVFIDWDNETRTVGVDSNKKSEIKPFYEISFNEKNEILNITGKKDISINIPEEYKNENYSLKLLLVDKNKFSGKIVSKVKANNNVLTYIPRVEDDGEKLLVGAIYDSDNKWIMGDTIKTNINVKPIVKMTINNDYKITPELNFLAKYVSYEIKNLSDDTVVNINKRDPYDGYYWNPSGSGEIDYNIQMIAVDFSGNEYISENIMKKVNLPEEISLVGINNGDIISSSDNLLAKRNFDVLETTYYIKDEISGVEKILATIPYGSYQWEPTKADSGKKLLKVSVIDTKGIRHDSDYVSVNIDFSPYLKIKGIGPNQVVTKSVEISNNTNVELDNIYYVFENYDKENKRTIVNGIEESNFTFNPNETDEGNVSITAYGKYNGETLKSETVKFKLYFGETYGPKAIIEKAKFLDLASGLAINSYKKTDMSAALQTAQAILESGWGQSVPVDKYSNKFSNNLFGIKGTGTDGSVISNTWEVYNGVVYRIDASFRAYNNVGESWQDHKNLLLKYSRYQIFRDVMYDDTLGAWSIRRAGYATDPNYPIKLMNIIEQYDLEKLDIIDL